MSKGLGKIAQRLALRPCLLCIKPKVIGITQHALKQQPGLIAVKLRARGETAISEPAAGPLQSNRDFKTAEAKSVGGDSEPHSEARQRDYTCPLWLRATPMAGSQFRHSNAQLLQFGEER
jgi:hypothetical protein